MFGADLASVDDPGQPDWQGAKDLGLGFVFLRASYSTIPDTFYASQKSRLTALGLPWGPYLFLCFPFKGHQPRSPEEQAQALIQAAGQLDHKLNFPPVLDIEFPGNGFSDTGMTHDQALDWIRRAYKVLRDHYGCAPIIYTSARVWHEDLGDPKTPDLTESPLWLARYGFAVRSPAVLAPNVSAPPIPPPWNDADNWWFHQYQGDSTGLRVFGCTVDLNRFNPMKIGAKGQRVKWVQERIGAGTDGAFGPKTQAALKLFQAAHNLAQTGEIDLLTFVALAWVTV